MNTDITPKGYIDNMTANLPRVGSSHNNWVELNLYASTKQDFIHPIGDLEYEIRETNLVRDYDLWRLLFSLDVEISPRINHNHITTLMVINNSFSENYVIKFKNQEDESLFLLSFKGYNP